MVKHITKDTIQYNIKKKMYSLLYFILNLKKKYSMTVIVTFE